MTKDNAVSGHGKTLRQLFSEFTDEQLDCQCTSLKATIKTPLGGTLKTDYSARRAAAIAKATGGSNAR